MARCPKCRCLFLIMEDEQNMHECPRCGYDGGDEEDLDPDIYCLKHGKELPIGEYGVRYGGCEDCEPPEPDGEDFRGGEAAAYEREQMAKWQRLK